MATRWRDELRQFWRWPTDREGRLLGPTAWAFWRRYAIWAAVVYGLYLLSSLRR